MPSVHYIDKEFLSRAGVRRAPRTARQILTNLHRDPDFFCFQGETRERRAARRDGDGIPRQGIVFDIASTPKTPRERKKGSPASVFDFESHGASQKNDAQRGAVADGDASNTASPHSDKGGPLQLEHEQGGSKSPSTCGKLGGFEEGQNVWVRTGKAHHSEYPAVIVSLRDGGDGSGTARVRWTTSNTIDEVEVEHLVPMFGGGESDAHGKRTGRETDHAAHDVVGDDEMQAGPAEMAKLRHRRLSPDEDDVDQVELPATSTALRKRTPSEEKDTPASDGPVKLIPGLELQRNGKWSTSVYFGGKSWYMGLFDTYDEAVLAHEAARREMATDKGSVEAVVQLAKESAAEAVRRSQERAYNDMLEPSDDESTAPMAREAALKTPSQCNAVPKPTLSKKKKRSTAGITKTSAGKWQLKICYRGQQRYFGTYDTIEQASLANETAREVLEADKGVELSINDIQRKIQYAKDAIRGALGRNDAPQSGAPKLICTPQLDSEQDITQKKKTTSTIAKTPSGKRKVLGVYATTSGKWIELGYYKRNRAVGTYATLEQAAFVNAFARELFRATEGLELTDEEIKENLKSVKAKAAGVLSEFLEMARARTPKASLEREVLPGEGECPFRTLGVRARNGRWEVTLSYHGTQCDVGTFASQDDAALASAIARGRLMAMDKKKLTSTEVKQQIELAIEAVSDVVPLWGSRDTETAASEADQDVAMGDSAREGDDLHSTSSSIDYGSFNVFRARHKKWETRIHYHGKKRQIGTFATRTEAAKANEIAHGMLVLTEDLELTPAEIEENVARAKEAAKNAVYETDGVENDTDVSEKDVSEEDVSNVDASEEEAPEDDASEEEAPEEDVSEEHASCAASETPHDLLSEPAKQQMEEETRLEDELTHNDSCEPNEEEPVGGSEQEGNSNFGLTAGASNDTWVECDRCKKWRRLRAVVDANELPSQWYCSMNKTDPDRAQCSAPEEEYDQQARRLQSLRVYATASGKKWYAELFYINKNRHLGTFATIEQAFFANAFARELALATEDLQLTEEEAKENIKLIKTRAAEVLSRFVAGTRAQTSNGTVRESPSAQEHCPFRRVGVKESHSGQWEVAFPYQGSQCIIGPFATQEDAAIANAVAQGYLATEDNQELTDVGVQNIDLAKEVASNAVSRHTRSRKREVVRKAVDIARTDEPAAEGALLSVDILPCEGEADQGGPRLYRGQTQPQKNFSSWLVDRKRKWRLQSQRHRNSRDQQVLANEAMSLSAGSTSSLGLSDEAKRHLSQWLDEHAHHPYPTRVQKDAMMTTLGITDERKLDGWFCRARKKLKESSQESMILAAQARAEWEARAQARAEWEAAGRCDQCGFLILHSQTHCAMCLAPAVPVDTTEPTGNSARAEESILSAELNDTPGQLQPNSHSTTDDDVPENGSAHLPEANAPSGDDDMEEEEWLCDICQTARFSTYDEAAEHERNCVGIPPPELSVKCSNTAEAEKEFRSKGNARGADLTVVAASTKTVDSAPRDDATPITEESLALGACSLPAARTSSAPSLLGNAPADRTVVVTIPPGPLSVTFGAPPGSSDVHVLSLSNASIAKGLLLPGDVVLEVVEVNVRGRYWTSSRIAGLFKRHEKRERMVTVRRPEVPFPVPPPATPSVAVATGAGASAETTLDSQVVERSDTPNPNAAQPDIRPQHRNSASAATTNSAPGAPEPFSWCPRCGLTMLFNTQCPMCLTAVIPGRKMVSTDQRTEVSVSDAKGTIGYGDYASMSSSKEPSAITALSKHPMSCSYEAQDRDNCKVDSSVAQRAGHVTSEAQQTTYLLHQPTFPLPGDMKPETYRVGPTSERWTKEATKLAVQTRLAEERLQAQKPGAFAAHAIARSRHIFNLQRMAPGQKLTSRGQTALISQDAPWFYVDLQGSVQGPFAGLQMRRWLDSGQLSNGLRISQNRGGPYSALSSYFPDRSVAFIGPTSRNESCPFAARALEDSINVEIDQCENEADPEGPKLLLGEQPAEASPREEAAEEPEECAPSALEAAMLDVEIRSHELETDGPKLIVGEQPAKEFKAWHSNRKRKWGRVQGPNDANTQDGTEADIAIAPGICQESNNVSGLSAEVDGEEVEVPPVAEKSRDEALLDIEILRYEGGADGKGPQLLQDEQSAEEFKVWLSDRKRKWGRLGDLKQLPSGRKRRKPERRVRKKFPDRIDDLKAYKATHGHLNVSRKEDQSLSDFCANVRRGRSRKSGGIVITEERVASLDAIGFDWHLSRDEMQQWEVNEGGDTEEVEITEDALLDIEIHRCIGADRHGSHLLPGRSQPKKEFDVWLAGKKETWQRHE